MAENNLPPVQMGQLETTYRELLVKLKAHVTQLDSQTDAMLCVKWIQKLQTLTKPNDIILRNYLLLQICNQIRSGYLDHPFINLSYLNQDLNVVANCCREWEAMSTNHFTTDDVLKMRSERSVFNTTDFYISDVDGTSEVTQSLAMQKKFQNKNSSWNEPKKLMAKPFDNVEQRQNFYQRKYEETLGDLKKAKLKLYLKSTQCLEELVEYLGANFIEKYQNATDELLSIEKSPSTGKEFLAFQLNFCSGFKMMCGDFLNANMAETLLRSEDQFQQIFNRILCNFILSTDSRKELVSTGRATNSTDLDVNVSNNTKYSDYLKRYIRKQQKQFKRKQQDYENQIIALKNEISLRDKKQSMQMIEMKCENIMRNEQKTRDQLSESVNELESKYRNIVQQIFNDLQEKT